MTREATIQRILEVSPVENSIFLDVVKVLGWQVVTKRNQFNVGDLCIYIALDSVVPDTPIFDFLRNEKFRIKTKRLRGALSQGIIFPLDILNIYKCPFLIEEGLDITDFLGVIHYEKQIPPEMRGLTRGNFPPWVAKTDENRIQNYPDVVNELKNVIVYSSVKCDGTSITCAYKDGDFHICSRNLSLKLEGNEENVYVKTAMKYKMRSKLAAYGKNIAIQGELCGPGIQKNRMGLTEYKIFVFNIWFINEQRYANMPELVKFCCEHELDNVPIINAWVFNNTVDQLLEMAKGKYNGTNNHREGIVIRPLFDNKMSKVMHGRMSFKVLNNDFLIAYKE